jgi:L-threonylcarbamoyladenylate synthase
MDYLKIEVAKALTVLRQGGIILYPTDTVWGIGCDATSAAAVEKLLDIKGRESTAGFVVLVDSEATLNRHVPVVPEIAYDILDAAIPEQPITIIYPDSRSLAPGVCARDGSVAIRMVKHTFCERLIFQLRAPITSSSANFKGQTPPRRRSAIDTKLLALVDHVVDESMDTSVADKPSSLIKIDISNHISILRH